MDTQALAIVVAATSAGSLSAAARQLGVAPVVASRRLAALERDLGVRLMHRTTRSIALTPEGESFLPFARQMLEREAAALAALEPAEQGVAGLLRVTAPAALGRAVIVPMLPELLAGNPQLRVELQLTERLVDVVREGFDIAIRIADLKDSALVARRIGRVRRLLCASPAYVAARGRPERMDDLASHDCLPLSGVTHWAFDTVAGERRVRVGGRLSCSTIDGLHAACLQGLGVAMLADWSAAADLAAGRLIALPLDAEPHAPPISAVYPTTQLAPARLRVFLAALRKAL